MIARLTAPTVASGTGQVNARAVDSSLKLIIDKINELIRALGVARGADNQLTTASVRWRMLDANLRESIRFLADQAASIRRQLDPGALNYTLAGKNIRSLSDGHGGRLFVADPYVDQYGVVAVPVGIGGDPSILYRLRFRIRSMVQRTYAHPEFMQIRGTVSGGGTTITGVGTFFKLDIVNPSVQPIYVRINGEIRRVVSTPTNVSLVISAPLSVPAVGATCETDHVPQVGPGPGGFMWQYVYTLPQPGWLLQHPFTFRSQVPFNVTQGRDFLTLDTTSPAAFHLLSWQPSLLGRPDEVEQLPSPRDFLYEVYAYGGSTLTFGSKNSDTATVFWAKSNQPPDDDPRFPALYRFPTGQTAQVDLLAIESTIPDSTPLLTEAGFPLQREAPTDALAP